MHRHPKVKLTDSLQNGSSINNQKFSTQPKIEMSQLEYLRQMEDRLANSQKDMEMRLSNSQNELVNRLANSQKELREDKRDMEMRLSKSQNESENRLANSLEELKKDLKSSLSKSEENLKSHINLSHWKVVVSVFAAGFGGMAVFEGFGFQILYPWNRANTP